MINAEVYLPTSPVTFYGYNYYPASEAADCIFVNQDIYAIIDMHDLHNNIILTNDTLSWYELFTFEFSDDSLFTAYHCKNFTGVEWSPWYKHTNMTLYRKHSYSNNTVVCPIRPLRQSYAQSLTFKYTAESNYYGVATETQSYM